MIYLAVDKYDWSQESHSSRTLIVIPCIMNIDTLLIGAGTDIQLKKQPGSS